MNGQRIDNIKRIRVAAIEALSNGSRLRRRELISRVLADRYCAANFTWEAVLGLIHDTVRLYEGDFYVCPSTKKISLTRERLSQLRVTRQFRAGTTGMAQAAEAMEAREC